jgi:DNA-binding transcriptional regulator YhcF (GntR family)
MRVAIDPADAAAPYDQVRRQIAAQARSGELAAGTRLPTVRALADELGLATGTVARAYKELEADGVITTRGRNGSVVSWSADAARGAVEQAAAALVAQSDAAGLERAALRAIVDAALRRSAG